MTLHYQVSGVIAVIFAGMTLCAPTNAQTMFRCGSTYQDRPCDGAQKGKVIGSTGTAQASSATPAVDGYCAQRGVDAQKIVWAREAGALVDKLLAGARNAEERKLIVDVYRRRGTSSDVRASIEADCVAEKERAALAAALLNAARLEAPAQPAAATTQGRANDADKKAADAASARENIAREASRKKSRCDDLKEQMGDIARQQRAGGSAEMQDGLSQQKRDTDRKLSQDGC